MNLLCTELREIVNQYSQEFNQIYAQKIPGRCQRCNFDTVPEPYTWLNMSNLIKQGERIFFCEKHIDYEDEESFYFNLTDKSIWCRKCETRFSIGMDFSRTIGKILNTQDSPGTRGLKNLGNTCFMNSVLQALSNCSQLKYYCLESISNLSVSEGQDPAMKVSQEFIRLIKNIWVKGSTFTPKDFVDTVYSTTELFVRKQQSDAHEFLIFLLNSLNDSIGTTGQKLIENIFQGEIVNKTTCISCKEESFNSEKFFDITVPVIDGDGIIDEESSIQAFFNKFRYLFSRDKKRVELKDCLDSNFAPFIADDSDMPNWKYCYNCTQKAPFKKEILLKIPPKCLILVLKRYSKNSKSSVQIFFPETVDLSFYMENREQKVIYNLYGIVEHVGFANIGHYKSYCKNHMDKCWYCFNDKNIFKVEVGKVLKIQGYIGLYELES